MLTIMIQFGVLEPTLQPGLSRLRWQCSCGDILFSDVTEVREGGVAELIAQMRRTSGVEVSVTTYDRPSGNQQYRGIHPHNGPGTTTVPAGPIIAPPQPALHLISCMHGDQFRKVLQQDRVETVTTDRTLLCFLRQRYHHHRGRFLQLAKLKRINGISFVKICLPAGGSVDVRQHNPCCAALPAAPSACECVPPKAKVEPSPTAEYRCIPGPPATIPPISPEYLASLLTCPTEVHEQDTWILNQLPKRICGKLQGQLGQPAEGWGIYYQEGWDRDLIIMIIFVLFLVGSLLFGVLWSRYHFDVQGAFGVSAYMVAASAGIITVVVTRAEKM
ncbi:hypothetical protein T440DRAFT_474292 [Plenodomus tracheiphilus IPT5]|uniref:Uncharacterized protein n=1 Tax=Plenodomus tracheiphilus IPT5 TaxID=1408161 RepID=A0A6A7BPW7_9PLEO|nr:hypothetical protein T440DRAFT_474292 [Plenodomus tracheiphilus IPT5]